MDVFGELWSYPGWRHVSEVLDSESWLVIRGGQQINLIPEFTMPPVSPTGPLYFYAAMFEPGMLSLETLVSNGAVWEFRLH